MSVLSKGFRPFFLLGAIFAAIVVPLWLAVLSGRVALGGSLQGPVWHAHEMIFGFTSAILAGFLLTAVGNWTGRTTATGGVLAGLAGLWASARVALLLVPGWPAAILDLLFLPALGLVLSRPLVATGNRRNLVFPVLLGLLWTGNLAVHLGAPAIAALRLSVYAIVAIILVITGRVVPMFTRNATGADARNVPALDAAAIAGVVLVAAATSVPAMRPVVPYLSTLAAVAVLGRMARWGFAHTLDEPLLWVLHVGHAWIAVGLVLEGGAALDLVPRSIPIHALTIGSIGTLTLGMMARVALGHTGRPIVAPPVIGAAFIGLLFAAGVRVFGPAFVPGMLVTWWWIAGVAWALSFATYVVIYAPILVRPRADGKPD